VVLVRSLLPEAMGGFPARAPALPRFMKAALNLGVPKRPREYL
jgi:hypothetical protein